MDTAIAIVGILLALVFCLLLAAAATASYAVPFFTKLIL